MGNSTKDIPNNISLSDRIFVAETNVSALHTILSSIHSMNKWLLSALSLLLTSGILFLGYNAYDAKSDIKNLKTELMDIIDKRLPASPVAPIIDVYVDRNLQPISGSYIEAKEYETAELNKKNYVLCSVYFTVKNIGVSPTSNLVIKVYSNSPLSQLTDSSDESKYKYEGYNFELPILPPDISYNARIKFILKEEDIDNEINMVMLKISYGGAKSYLAEFGVKIDKGQCKEKLKNVKALNEKKEKEEKEKTVNKK